MSYQFDSGTFQSNKVGGALTYGLGIQNSNSSWPVWLQWNSLTLSITGTPPADADYSFSLELSATDRDNEVAKTPATLLVKSACFPGTYRHFRLRITGITPAYWGGRLLVPHPLQPSITIHARLCQLQVHRHTPARSCTNAFYQLLSEHPRLPLIALHVCQLCTASYTCVLHRCAVLLRGYQQRPEHRCSPVSRLCHSMGQLRRFVPHKSLQLCIQHHRLHPNDVSGCEHSLESRAGAAEGLAAAGKLVQQR